MRTVYLTSIFNLSVLGMRKCKLDVIYCFHMIQPKLIASGCYQSPVDPFLPTPLRLAFRPDVCRPHSQDWACDGCKNYCPVDLHVAPFSLVN